MLQIKNIIHDRRARIHTLTHKSTRAHIHIWIPRAERWKITREITLSSSARSITDDTLMFVAQTCITIHTWFTHENEESLSLARSHMKCAHFYFNKETEMSIRKKCKIKRKMMRSKFVFFVTIFTSNRCRRRRHRQRRRRLLFSLFSFSLCCGLSPLLFRSKFRSWICFVRANSFLLLSFFSLCWKRRSKNMKNHAIPLSWNFFS